MKTEIAPWTPQGLRHPALPPRVMEPPAPHRGIAILTLAAALACGPFAFSAEARPALAERSQAQPAGTAASTAAPTNTRRARARRRGQYVRAPRMPDRPQDFRPVATGSFALSTMFQGPPRAACLDATRRAEQIHGLPPGLLGAIALSESGMHAYAMNIGGRAVFPESPEAAAALLRAASQSHNVMAGCMQVNARLHARGETWPLDARLSADWAGGMLARWGQEHGWAEALRRWHGASTSATPRLVCRVRAKMEVTHPGSGLFREYNCNTGSGDRTRRNGEVHFNNARDETI